jgi:parallel beta-helix repeat protein
VRDQRVWRKEGWTEAFVRQNYARGTNLLTPNVYEVFQKDGLRGEAVVLFRVGTPQELREGKCYWEEKTGTITIWPYGEDFDPNANGVEVAVRGRAVTVGRRFVRVRGLQMRQFGMAAVTNWPAAGIFGADCLMEDCTLTWSDFGGMSMSGFRNVMRRCEGSYCGNSGFGAGVGEGMLLEDSVFTHNNFWRYSPGWHGGAAKIIPWFNKSTVRNCEFAYSYGPGVWFDGSCNDSLIEGNRCHDNEGPGIMVEISRGTIVRNNICYNNRNSLPGVDIMPVEGKGYAPLVCRQLRSEGGGGGEGIFISSSPDTRVYHNLCYRNEGMGIFAEWAKRTSADVTDYAASKSAEVAMSTHGVDLQGNILVNNGAGQLSLRRNGVDEDTYGNHSDYNLLYSATGRPLVIWGFGGLQFTKLDKWQAASGFDGHSIVAAPVFEFSPSLDFRLQPDSPGVDQGRRLPEVAADARGAQRPLGAAPDMGPYEIAGTRRILERPKLPTDLAYFQVELSKLANRAFADEKADDGQGGWSDQGPTTDLGMFPTGDQNFSGVPFKVLSPRGCLVLKSGYRPQSKDLPSRVVIPIHRKAEVLYFLHSGAWLGGGKHEWSYIIHRGDGTSETIKVVGGDNIRDWSAPNPDLPFDREFPTTTQVAWTGRNQTFEKVSVYMMGWLNANAAWCDVTEVEMVGSEEGGVPILIAITGGVKK